MNRSVPILVELSAPRTERSPDGQDPDGQDMERLNPGLMLLGSLSSNKDRTAQESPVPHGGTAPSFRLAGGEHGRV